MAACRKVLGCCPVEVLALSGGFNNANFAIDQNQVLRIYASGVEIAAREASVLALVAGAGVKVPAVLRVDSFEGHGVLLLTLEPGRLLDETADFSDVGAQLARIHSIGFERYGLFGPDCRINPVPPNYGMDLVRKFLEGRAGQRLGPDLVNAVRRLPSPRSDPRSPTLVHGDFNPKNILVSTDGKVSAILDWEFAMANDPLIDLGNFLRFSEDYSVANAADFERGYIEGGGSLPDDWAWQGHLHDVVCLLSFLDSDEDNPETFATALERLSKILFTKRPYA